MNYAGKKVLILGLGINQGGVGAAKFFAKQGAQVVVTDLKTKAELQQSIDQLAEFPEIEYILGEHRFEDIDNADLIIRNPALKPDNPYLVYAKEHGKEVEMDLGIFVQFVNPQQIIGVTGSKGKSTTASLIYEILSQNNKNVIFAGNIGRSMLDTIEHVTEDSIVILELSSFQLQALETHKVSPHWAVITNIFPEHLNYHQTMENYVDAKRQITAYQTEKDFLFLNKNDEVTHQPVFLKDLKAQIIEFAVDQLPTPVKTQLPGEHNLENIAGAVAVAQSLGIEQSAALTAVEDFSGVEFRLQMIKEYNGVTIINDSAATNPQAAIEALKSFPDSLLVVGGMNKNLSYEDLAKAVDQYGKKVFLIEGDATEDLKKFMVNKDKIVGEYNNLDALAKDLLAQAQKGDVILFSPGATSFNFWKNEFDRGRQFNTAVNKLVS